MLYLFFISYGLLHLPIFVIVDPELCVKLSCLFYPLIHYTLLFPFLSSHPFASLFQVLIYSTLFFFPFVHLSLCHIIRRNRFFQPFFLIYFLASLPFATRSQDLISSTLLFFLSFISFYLILIRATTFFNLSSYVLFLPSVLSFLLLINVAKFFLLLFR